MHLYLQQNDMDDHKCSKDPIIAIGIFTLQIMESIKNFLSTMNSEYKDTCLSPFLFLSELAPRISKQIHDLFLDSFFPKSQNSRVIEEQINTLL